MKMHTCDPAAELLIKWLLGCAIQNVDTALEYTHKTGSFQWKNKIKFNFKINWKYEAWIYVGTVHISLYSQYYSYPGKYSTIQYLSAFSVWLNWITVINELNADFCA